MCTKKKTYKPVTHVIFSLDGLIVNSDVIMRKVLNEVMAEYKRGPLTPELEFKISGRSERDTINMLINELRIPIRYPLMKQKINKLEDDGRYKKCKLLTGVERLVCHFKRNKIPMAIATSSRIETYEDKLFEYKGIKENFHHVVAGSSDEEVEQSKPDPTILTLCASRFDEPVPSPACCLVFENSIAGVSAACCAKMQVVMVADPQMDPDLASEATVLINSLADFKPEPFSLPPYIC